jgi:hypothetical protein
LDKIVGIIFNNPSQFGLASDGVLTVGDKIDLTEFDENNNEELKKIIAEAKKIILPGSSKEKETLNLDPKWIAQPLKENVTEKIQPEIKIVTNPVVSMDAFKEKQEEKIKNEISVAEGRLKELEKGRNPNLERTYISDTKAYYSERDLMIRAEEAFRKEIGRMYGEKGFMGIGKKSGIDTKEWKDMSGLSAVGVVKYATGDSQNSGLSPQAVEKITKSSKHIAFLQQIVGLMEQTKGDIKPFEKENVEQFFKRLGEHVLKNYLIQQQKQQQQEKQQAQKLAA